MIETFYQYDAFISYRRTDGSNIGKWLRNYLTAYKLPSPLGKKGDPPLKIYLDTSYEVGSIDFYSQNIKPSLQISKHLIFVVTPATKITNTDGTPNWSMKELNDFQNFDQKNNIILVLAKGSFADIPGHIFNIYPNIEIVDLRKYFTKTPVAFFNRLFFKEDLLKITGPVFNVPINDMPLLRQEENKRKKKTNLLFMFIVITLLASVFSYTTFIKNKSENIKQKALTTYQKNAVNLVLTNGDLDDIAGSSEAQNSLLGNTCPILDTLASLTANDSLFNGCAICHAYIANIMFENYDYTNAAAEINKSINYLNLSIELNPKSTAYARQLSRAYYHKARILKQMFKYDSSEYYIKKAINFINKKDTEKNTSHLLSKTNFYNFYAILHESQGNFQSSDTYTILH